MNNMIDQVKGFYSERHGNKDTLFPYTVNFPMTIRSIPQPPL